MVSFKHIYLVEGYLNLNRIELQTLADNEVAIQLYERLGFHKVGLLREKSFESRSGAYTDVLYMDLLHREWKEVAVLFNGYRETKRHKNI